MKIGITGSNKYEHKRKIKEFLLNIFAGQLVSTAFDWLKDPKNREALKQLKDFKNIHKIIFNFEKER